MIDADKVRITSENIECFRGALKIRNGDLDCPVWGVFDQKAFTASLSSKLVKVNQLVSPKDQLQDPKFIAGTKPDPRQTALQFMKRAAEGEVPARPPLRVRQTGPECFEILDGNATAQVLMLVGWDEVPVEVID